MFVTSTGEALLPSGLDLIVMNLDELFNFPQLCAREAVVLRQFNIRLQPIFRLTIRTNHVYVHPRLLAREEKETVSFLPKNRWTHELKCLDAAMYQLRLFRFFRCPYQANVIKIFDSVSNSPVRRTIGI